MAIYRLVLSFIVLNYPLVNVIIEQKYWLVLFFLIKNFTVLGLNTQIRGGRGRDMILVGQVMVER